MLLLRAMNPQVIAVDEVALQEDVKAMAQAVGAGVALLASVHGESIAQVRAKPLFAPLFAAGAFAKAVCIRCEGGQRHYQVETLL